MLKTLTVNGGQVEFEAQSARGRMWVPATGPHRYTNAQLDDYHGAAPGCRFRWPRFANRPPMKLSLRARASHAAPLGTLGFGFWNEPFSLSGAVLSTPKVVWFFHASPPSDMVLVHGVPGCGWKAATLNTLGLPGIVVAPAALVGLALTRLPGLGRPLMALARRLVAAHESMLLEAPLDEWHHYELDWQRGEARFSVDGVERLRSPAPPGGPLGFVMWIDNQYAIASEAGRFGFGVIPLPEPQWLEVEAFRLMV